MTGRSIRELRAEAAELEKRIAELPIGYISTKKIDGMYVYIDPEFRNGEFENKHWVK